MDNQLQQLIDLQKEQNALLKKYLWRLRFSLLTLLLLTTGTAIGLVVLSYSLRPAAAPTAPTATATFQFVPQPQQGNATLQLQPIQPPPADDLFGPPSAQSSN
jgi:hypothetical protein